MRSKQVARKPTYLGRHTAASWIVETGNSNAISYLRENSGKLPPFILAFGDRRRVLHAARILKLRDIIEVHKIGEYLSGPEGSGRVNLVIGTFGPEKQPLPITLIETQMGCPATQINLREILALSSTDGYLIDPKSGLSINSNSIYVVRAGTCGGINLSPGQKDEKPILKVGDVVVAEKNMGHIGTVFQSMGILDVFAPDAFERYSKAMLRLGFEMVGHYHMSHSNPTLVRNLVAASRELGLTPHHGTNMSKDSLYAEADERAFVDLRLEYGVLSSEMEQVLIDFEAARFNRDYGITVHTGLISCIVGLVPGGSFAADPAEQKRARDSESGILKAAAMALHKIVYPS